MGIQMDKPPGEMHLDSLTDCCMNEVNKYRRGEPHDDSYCLEIFRRAMLQHDERAWAVLHQRFHETMLGWLRRHPSGKLACQIESEQYYVDRSFERFWRATSHNQALEFSTLGAALYYLKASLNGEIMDTLRSHRRAREVALPDVGLSEHSSWKEHESSRQDGGFAEPLADESDDGSELWEAIKSLLTSERELRVAYLLYHCNLKPREIVRYVPDEFDDVQEIYHLGRNIYERLMRNRDQLRWRLGGEELNI
jgi:hypothetical protein